MHFVGFGSVDVADLSGFENFGSWKRGRGFWSASLLPPRRTAERGSLDGS
jgi:hypothetical protein